MIFSVQITPIARKQLRKVPHHIAKKFMSWVDEIERRGLYETRKRPAYHDEPLKGDLQGKRSIRLNKSYRGIYTVDKDGRLEFVSVKEVHNHDY